MDTPVSMTIGTLMPEPTKQYKTKSEQAGDSSPVSVARGSRHSLYAISSGRNVAPVQADVSISTPGLPTPALAGPGKLRSSLGNVLVRSRLRALALVSPVRAAKWCVDLYCTPGAAVHAIDHRGARHCRLQVDDCELATYVWGDPSQQPYVLVAHGWSGHALEHPALVEALRAAGYAVVAFDQRGHGRSTSGMTSLPDFVCNLLAVGWRYGRATAVIGHSLGGAAATVALSHGLEAEHLILIGANADPDDAIRRFARSLGMGASMHRRMAALLEQRTGVALDDLQAHRVAPMIGRPTLVVHDIEDKEVPWDEGERYARYLPHSQLLTTSGIAHQRLASNAAVIQACLGFLRGNKVGERIVSSLNLPYGVA